MHWAAHLYRIAVRNLRPVQRRRQRRSLRLESLELRAVPHITGTVFIDLNQDGVQDPEDLGVAGVIVRATDETGVTSETTTGDDGTYELESDAETLRLAFSGFPDGTLPGRVIGTSGPVVRFLTADSARTDQNLSLASPTLVTTQFFYDRGLDGANSAEGAVLAVPYGVQDTAFPTPLATVADVGSVWGVAYHPASNSVYVSSFLKRHAGLGPNAAGTGTTTGGIYRIDRSTDPATVSLLTDLNAGTGFSTGADPHPALSEADGGDWFHDAATLPLVGKRGLGGLQVSPDGTNLYTVNLNSRELIQIPIKQDGTLDSSRSLTHTVIPLTNPAGSAITAFNAANLRPFAVAVKGSTVYVGVTYTAETGGGASDLRAFVFAFNPATSTFNPTPVLTARLNYPRGIADDPTPDDEPGDEISANWRPWISSFDTASGQEGFPVHPQPWLTDIVFDGNTMVLGIRDRFGDQGGFQTGSANAADESQFSVIAAGDILRAIPNGSGGWQLETGGSAGASSSPGVGNGQGPGGGEFYVGDAAEGGPQEVGTGGLAQVPGFRTVAATGNDPIETFSGGIFTFLNSDTDPSPTSNAGTAATRGEIYSTFDLNTFGNANGLGDLAAVPTVGTVEAGDRVFADSNSNGIQDANEPGIVGVAVGLYQGSTLVDTQTTDDNGDFLFSDLTPNVPYSLQINMIQAAIGGRSLAQANKGTDDEVDSDATLNGTTAKLDFTSPSEGSSVHSLDVGFAGPVAAAGVLTLGDTVFRDANNDGTFGAGETGVAGVTVELLDSTGATVLGTTTTDASGVYSFTSLDPGTYIVRLAASNFQSGGALVGFTASATSSSDPNDDKDKDSNGAASGTLGSGGVILSGPITLADGAEPVDDGDTDANTNLSLDFGVVPPAAAVTLTLGNQVWNDANNNGLLDNGETGVNGVTVQLLSSTGTVLQTTTTAGGGLYTFAGLAAGDYRVRLAEANFQTGGALVGQTSSTFTSPGPNDNVNNNDDGSVTGTLGQAGGFIQSGLISLAAGSEPTNDGDTDNNTNLSLDFGVLVPSANASQTLGNTVWNDVNNNGLLDSGESGIPGVSVQLLNAAGAVVQQAVTNASGQYSFTGLAAGDYRVRLAASNFTGSGPLVGFTSSTGTNGSAIGAFEGAGTPDPDDNTNNDDNGQVSGTLGQAGGFIQSGLITLSANNEPTNDGDTDPNTNLTLDLGVFRKFSIGNLVFNDLNNNGTRDTGESGLPNVTIRLLNADLSFALVGTVTTNAQGQFLFTNLIAGNYALDVAASNFNSGGVLASFKSSTGLNNAFEPAPSSATDNQDHGSTTGPLGSGGSVQSQTIAIGPGMPTGESPNNDANTPDNQSNLTIDFGMFQQAPTGAGISGRVFLDYNNSGTFGAPDTGIQGVTITLSGAGLSTPITVQTDAQGNFIFANLAAGTYTVTETQPTTPPNQSGKTKAGTAGGSTATANTISNIVLAANEQATGYTFAEVPIVSTGGSVYEDTNGNGQKDAGEPGISGAIVTLTGTSVVTGTIQSRSVLTDTSGNYSFTNLTPGTYNIVETQPGGFVDGKEQNGTPAAATVTNDHFTGINLTTSAATSGGFNFGEVKGASIAGVVYDDVNDDGAQGTGETGIAGVTVTLAGTNDLGQAVSKTTTTAADGSYSFTGLRPGTYRVVESQPTLYRDGKDTAGTSGGNATAVNDHITGIVLASGATATGYLFGEHGTADVIVTMTPVSTTVAPGGQVTITYTAKNRGTAVANAVAVTLTYGGLTFVSSNSSNFDNATKKWTVGDLAAGATQTITVTFRVPAAGGTFGPAAHATTTSTELSTTNNSDSSTIFAGVVPPPQPTGGGSLWFLSSSTNATKTPR